MAVKIVSTQADGKGLNLHCACVYTAQLLAVCWAPALVADQLLTDP